MSRIGYGCTKPQVQDMVKKILDRDGRPSPFANKRPGEKWWKLFKERHPELSLRQPEHLQLSRARCTTPEAIRSWFVEFELFLIENGVKDSPSQIWNADESGFPLCPKTGRVLAVKTDKNVYGITGDSKEQITCLCAANAAGDVLPPMHVFAGERVRYNPMANCVPNAYFGHSTNGWITTELFFGWLANHFAKLVTVRPVVLLVDGHSSHIDLEVSRFCSENQILLYCLPPHSSHLLQPLDVGFFKSLKNAWAKECNRYRATAFGAHVTKETFSEVFRCAWLASVKISLFVNAFRECGICPLRPSAIDESKLAPSMPYCSQTVSSPPCSSTTANEVIQLEKMMKPETVRLYEERFDEGYDVESDELYCIWSKLKKLTISGQEEVGSEREQDVVAPIPAAQQKVSSALDEVLTYPKPPAERQKKGKSTSSMPKHLSSQQMIDYLEEKRVTKQREEEEKQRRKEEREKKRIEREEERKRKLAEKEKQKKDLAERRAQRGRRGGHGQGHRPGRGQACGQDCLDSDDDLTNSHDALSRGGRSRHFIQQRNRNQDEQEHVESDKESTSSSGSSGNYCCPICGLPTRLLWVACNSCNRWFHAECTDIDPDNFDNLQNVDWVCNDCVRFVLCAINMRSHFLTDQ